MPYRELPARPSLDHLKNEAKSLLKAHRAGNASATERLRAAIGEIPSPKLTDAQRVIAREHGFFTWEQLRAHVQSTSSQSAAIAEFLRAIQGQDRNRATQVLEAQPAIRRTSLHVAAALGDVGTVRDLLAKNRSFASKSAGQPAAQPLLFLCFSPFHGESAARDQGLLESARLLLAAGADPNPKDGQYGVPALYAVTGIRSVVPIAKLLLAAGANPTDGESLHHSAENFHEEALELLLAAGADLNATGDWGNTPLYFLLRWYDLETHEATGKGVEWLLAHGADPNARSGPEREPALHVAIRRGQSARTIESLLDRGADPTMSRGDGRTPWQLAMHAGRDDIARLLERRGAAPAPLSDADRLLGACAGGDVDEARRLGSADALRQLTDEDRRLIVEAARRGHIDSVRACLAAGFPIDTLDEYGATPIHHAAIAGHASLVRELIGAGASLDIIDGQHHSPPIGWATWGSDFIRNPKGDYPETVRAFLDAGVTLHADLHQPENAAVRALLHG